MDYISKIKLPNGSILDVKDANLTERVNIIESSSADYVNSGSYNSVSKKIELVHDDTVLAEIDTTDFIKDGMVDDVTISGSNLIITFNTDAGKEDITIPISDIFDADNYYTKTDVDDKLVWERGINSSSAVLKDAANTASGNFSVVAGLSSSATGVTSYAEGYKTFAGYSDPQSNYTAADLVNNNGFASHVEGQCNVSLGAAAHVEGQLNSASGISSHAEGYSTKASGSYSHAEGLSTIASGKGSHAEGSGSLAYGFVSHAEGMMVQVEGTASHAEGHGTKTSNDYEHAQGRFNVSHVDSITGFGTPGNTLHSIGIGANNDYRSNAVEVMQNGDVYIKGIGGYSGSSIDSSSTLQQIINNNISPFTSGSGGNSVILKNGLNVASGSYAAAVGYKGIVEGDYAHAEGFNNIANNTAAHAEGLSSSAAGSASHVEGFGTLTMGDYAHAEGYGTSIGYGARFEYLGTGTYEYMGEMYDGYGYRYMSGYRLHDGRLYKIGDNITRVIFEISETSFDLAVLDELIGDGTQPYSIYDVEYAGALGNYSHVEGLGTKAINQSEHAQGQYNESHSGSANFGGSENTIHSIGIGASAESRSNAVEVMQNGDVYVLGLGGYSGSGLSGSKTLQNVFNNIPYEPGTGTGSAVLKGSDSTASGDYSHAEGQNTIASGTGSHTEGNNTKASGSYAHAEGRNTIASGYASHAEGWKTEASGTMSHAEGDHTSASGYASHAEGLGTTASGTASHAEGQLTSASGNYSHVEGSYTTASGVYSHAEGYSSSAAGSASHAEGENTKASGSYAHAEGGGTTASGGYSHTEGTETIASGYASHAEGRQTTATGSYTHAEGSSTTASGGYSHTEGENTTASGYASHAEGWGTTATEDYSHAEGYSATASGDYSHAEGSSTTATGKASHAEGYSSSAAGSYTHVEGCNTIALNIYEHAQGQYNASHSGSAANEQTICSIGVGASVESRSNAFEVMRNGDVYVLGLGGYDGTNAGVSGVLTLQQLIGGLSA